MSEIQFFTAEQREVIKREVERHAIAAYERGITEGKRQAGPVAIAAWLKGAWQSWTMRAGMGALAMGVTADVWPVAAEFL